MEEKESPLGYCHSFFPPHYYQYPLNPNLNLHCWIHCQMPHLLSFFTLEVWFKLLSLSRVGSGVWWWLTWVLHSRARLWGKLSRMSSLRALGKASPWFHQFCDGIFLYKTVGLIIGRLNPELMSGGTSLLLRFLLSSLCVVVLWCYCIYGKTQIS